MRILAESASYVPLGKMHPVFLLDEHPDGVHVALQALSLPHSRAAVWDRLSRQQVWVPESTQALCWLPGGQEVLLLCDRPARVWNPHFIVERRAWPTHELRSTCPIVSDDANWAGEIVASPRGNLAVVKWIEQHIAGIELVEISPHSDTQIEDAGYSAEPNCVSSPVFSPDSRYLVMGCGREVWWNEEEDQELSSPGGRFRMGHVFVRDLDQGSQREIPIEVDIPEGWAPGDGNDETVVDQPIGNPRFESDIEFLVPLLTGGSRRLSATAE
jgi:hypothetical protein